MPQKPWGTEFKGWSSFQYIWGHWLKEFTINQLVKLNITTTTPQLCLLSTEFHKDFKTSAEFCHTFLYGDGLRVHSVTAFNLLNGILKRWIRELGSLLFVINDHSHGLALRKVLKYYLILGLTGFIHHYAEQHQSKEKIYQEGLASNVY